MTSKFNTRLWLFMEGAWLGLAFLNLLKENWPAVCAFTLLTIHAVVNQLWWRDRP